jgi:hypothetical protein
MKPKSKSRLNKERKRRQGKRRMVMKRQIPEPLKDIVGILNKLLIKRET